MIAVVQEFFVSGKNLKQWNSTAVTLIRKKPSASKISEFRPISCCNTLYKVISKLLANRLKQILPSIISNSQSAFIPGRSLAENVLLATELVAGYNWKNISKRAMLKVDLQKAFDTVNWDFVLNTVKALNFPTSFVNLIKQCLTTTSFSISINGELCGYFKGTRGLRQGDPLSPYLFVLVMEVFCRMLNENYSAGLIGFHPKAEHPQVTHLAFADDIMVFFDGSKDSLENIAKTLHEFTKWSGLSMNRSKTDLFTGGLTHDETNDLASLGFNLGSLPIRYLGLPLMHRNLRIDDYRPLLDKLRSYFTLWTSRALSYAGRLQMLKSVIYGLLNFWFTAFILPKGCITQIQTLCSRFLWSGDVTKRCTTKVAWNVCCLPKEEGGLGLRNLSTWNRTLCLRLIWVLFCNSDSLWASWIKENKFQNKEFWEIETAKHFSSTWKIILSLRHTASTLLKCRLGNGKRASFWHDSWTPFGPLINYIGQQGPRELGILPDAKIASALTHEGWNMRHARSNTGLELQIHLSLVSFPHSSDPDDEYYWCVNEVKLDKFSAKHTWDFLRPRGPVQEWTANVWFKGAVPRHAFHLWVTHLDRLPTRSRLASWYLPVDQSCCLCGNALETRDHLFLRCEVSRKLWSLITRRLGYRSFTFHTWTVFTSWLGSQQPTQSSTLCRLAAQATIYILWYERNNRLHNNISSSPAALFKQLDRLIKDAILARRKLKGFGGLLRRWLAFA